MMLNICVKMIADYHLITGQAITSRIAQHNKCIKPCLTALIQVLHQLGSHFKMAVKDLLLSSLAKWDELRMPVTWLWSRDTELYGRGGALFFWNEYLLCTHLVCILFHFLLSLSTSSDNFQVLSPIVCFSETIPFMKLRPMSLLSFTQKCYIKIDHNTYNI